MQSMYWRKAYIRYITVVVIGICFTWLLYPSRSHFLYMIRDPWIHDEMEKNKKAEWKKNEKVFEKENLRWIEYDPHIISRDHHHRISIQHYYNHSYIVHSQFILSVVIAMSRLLYSFLAANIRIRRVTFLRINDEYRNLPHSTLNWHIK